MWCWPSRSVSETYLRPLQRLAAQLRAAMQICIQIIKLTTYHYSTARDLPQGCCVWTNSTASGNLYVAALELASATVQANGGAEDAACVGALKVPHPACLCSTGRAIDDPTYRNQPCHPYPPPLAAWHHHALAWACALPCQPRPQRALSLPMPLPHPWPPISLGIW